MQRRMRKDVKNIEIENTDLEISYTAVKCKANQLLF